MQKIAPCLWFDNNAQEAVDFYCSVFKNARIKKTVPYSETGPGTPGSVMTILFELEGQDFMAVNGGPHFTFTPAISLMVTCQTQPELDALWNKLSAVPEAEQCGWLCDKFGLSWQIVPSLIGELMGKDSKKSQAMMQALLGMKKLDIAALQRAYDKG